MNHSNTIVVTCPRFFSNKDEAAFFTWLQSIASIRSVHGSGEELRIELKRASLSQRDLLNLLALFHRYGVRKDVLRRFDRPASSWFRDKKAYWYGEVFGKKAESVARKSEPPD